MTRQVEGRFRPVTGTDGGCRIRDLAVTWRHAMTVRTLADHHRDPFDRMLIAQAISEPLRLITNDARLRAYGNLVMLV